MGSSAIYGHGGLLVGRQAERARIDAVIADARGGRSRTIVVSGEPGIGKTTLLRYAAHTADRMTVVRTQGVPSEGKLAFAALGDICRPLLRNLEDLPAIQAHALRAALGIEAGVVVDALTVGAATLSLLAAAAEHAPVLVLVDDAQWVDDASVSALVFAARRLEADAVAVIFAQRDGSDPVGDGAFEELMVAGLTRTDAAALLADVDVGANVAERLYHATAGNPLALVELPKGLTRTQLSGEEPLTEPLPVGARVQRAFSSRLNEMSKDDRRALVIVAASSFGEPSIVLAAIASAGIAAAALERAEDAGLLRLSSTCVEFRHPLVRAAVHGAASPSERRKAHGWLAAAHTDAGDRDQAAWHLATAAFGPDEDAAQALEDVAHTTLQRGACSVAARGFERAAELTADRGVRDERLADAAGAYWAAGDAQRARELLDDVLTRISAH